MHRKVFFFYFLKRTIVKFPNLQWEHWSEANSYCGLVHWWHCDEATPFFWCPCCTWWTKNCSVHHCRESRSAVRRSTAALAAHISGHGRAPVSVDCLLPAWSIIYLLWWRRHPVCFVTVRSFQCGKYSPGSQSSPSHVEIFYSKGGNKYDFFTMPVPLPLAPSLGEQNSTKKKKNQTIMILSNAELVHRVNCCFLSDG